MTTATATTSSITEVRYITIYGGRDTSLVVLDYY